MLFHCWHCQKPTRIHCSLCLSLEHSALHPLLSLQGALFIREPIFFAELKVSFQPEALVWLKEWGKVKHVTPTASLCNHTKWQSEVKKHCLISHSAKSSQCPTANLHRFVTFQSYSWPKSLEICMRAFSKEDKMVSLDLLSTDLYCKA